MCSSASGSGGCRRCQEDAISGRSRRGGQREYQTLPQGAAAAVRLACCRRMALVASAPTTGTLVRKTAELLTQERARSIARMVPTGQSEGRQVADRRSSLPPSVRLFLGRPAFIDCSPGSTTHHFSEQRVGGHRRGSGPPPASDRAAANPAAHGRQRPPGEALRVKRGNGYRVGRVWNARDSCTASRWQTRDQT
jgi:hypothetical protein